MRKLYLFFILLFVFFSSVISAWGQIYNIKTLNGKTITDPNGYFYDSGGNVGNYLDDEDLTVTFKVSLGKSLVIDFEDFNVENGYDILKVSDAGGSANYTNRNAPSKITLTGGGEITYRFTSDYTQTRSGWRAKLTLIDPHHFYSYQSGNWDTKETWTLDPSGTVFVDGGVPTAGDQVTILNGRSVNVTSNNKDITAVEIETGGILDLGSSIGHTFTELTGSGLLKLATNDFPNGVPDAFMQSGGGTVEYNFSGARVLENSVTNYNNLIVNLSTDASIARIANDLQINGDLTVKQGHFTIYEGGNRNIVIENNLLIEKDGQVDIDQDNRTRVHRLEIKGDFTNNGQAVFFTYAFPDYSGARWNDRCHVIFSNPNKDQNVQLNGYTRFYRIEIDKGVDDTYVLNIDASEERNFNLYGKNNYSFNSAPGAGNFANDNSLGLLAGTVRIGRNVVIPCLSSSGDTYWIDSDAKLWVDGGTVVVSDKTSYSFESLVVYGKITLSNGGSFTDIGKQGIVFRETAILRIDDGSFEARMIRTSSWTNSVHRGTFIMNGGNLTLHGSTSLSYHATFSLPYPDNVFIMTGGTITINNPTVYNGGIANNFSLLLNPNLGNSLITGGTININVPATRDAAINTNMALWNVNITGSSSRSLLLNSYVGNASPPVPGQLAQDLVVKNNLTITTTKLDANNQNVIIGGDFNLNGTYIPRNNTTTFNGLGLQNFNVNGTITGNLNNLSISNKSKTALNNNSITVKGDFTLNDNCRFDDNSNNVYVIGNLDISGEHRSQANGSIQLQGNADQTISGNGAGIFGNLVINKNSGSTLLDASITVNKNLRLVGTSSSIDMGDKNVHLSAVSNIYSVLLGTNKDFSVNKMMYTNGNSSDGGITFDFDSPITRSFPIGVSGKYTPMNISLNAAAVTYGDITVRPVDRKPGLAQSNNILDYFWRINSSGFVGISAGSIDIDCNYLRADVVGNEDEYRPGYFQNSKWEYIDDKSKVKDVLSTPTIFYDDISQIDGLYTAGEPDAFADIKTYYSIKDGNWNDPSTWSTDNTNKWLGIPDGTIPNSTSLVIIGDGLTNNHTVEINYDGTQAALLLINKGSVLDFNTTINNFFKSVSSLPGVEKGRIRIGKADFPGGDWGEFLGESGGTVEYYNETNSRYEMPNNNYPSAAKNEYCNLIINTNHPTANKQIDFVDADLLVHNDLIKEGVRVSLFNTNSHTIEAKGNLFVKEGMLRFYRNNGNTLIVRNDIFIDNGATLDINSGANHILESYGNIVNNGILNLNSGANRAATIFKGFNSVTISGSGLTTNFYTVEVDKGNSKDPLLDVKSDKFTLSNLTLVNGTFRLSSAVSINLTNVPFNIPETAALSANGGTINVGINDDDSDIDLKGRIEVLNGVINVGALSNTRNNDIIVAATGKPEVVVRGGQLNVQGQIRRPASVAMGSLNYIQSGGEVNIYGKRDIGDITNRADLEVLNPGSRFDMDGGKIIIHQPGNTTFGDLYLNAESSNVTAGEIQLGSNSSTIDTRRNFNIFLANKIYDLRISGSKTFTAQLFSFPLNAHSLFIDMDSEFHANGKDVILSGDLENNNGDSGIGLNRGGYRVQSSTQTTTFTGSGNKRITSTELNTTNFANLVIESDNGTKVSVERDICVNADLTINSGVLSNNKPSGVPAETIISIYGNVYNKSVHESLDGGYIEFKNNSLQTIDGNDFGVFGTLKISNFRNVKALNDFRVNGDINLNTGSLQIDEYQLTLGENAKILNANINNNVITNGALRDMGILKYFTAGNNTFDYHFGVDGKYTPAKIEITGATTGGMVRVRPIDFAHKSADAVIDNQLNYYWSIYSDGLTGASFKKTFEYNPIDVTGDVSKYVGGYYKTSVWVKPFVDNVDEGANTITFDSSADIQGEYTAGEVDNFVDKPILYSRLVNGNWHNANSWSTSPTGTPIATIPNGNPVVIQAGHTINVVNNECFAYSVDVKGIIDFGNTNKHDVGFVKGNGVIKIKSTNEGYFVFPGGDFSQFMGTTGSTIEYYGNGTLPEIRFYQNVVFSSDGNINTISLANNGFTAYGDITINPKTFLDNGWFSKRIIAKKNWYTIGIGTLKPGFGTVVFDGDDAQEIHISTDQQFYNLVINNSKGVTLIRKHVTILNNLSLTSGIVTTSSSSILKLNNTSPNAIIGGGSYSYVDGPLQKNISSGGYFYFPIGNNGRYASTLIFNTNSVGDDYWEAQYFNDNPDNAGMDNSQVIAPLETVSNNEYWHMQSSVGNTAGIRLRWDNLSGIIPANASDRLTKMRIGRWNGSKWELAGKRVLDRSQTEGNVESLSDLAIGDGYYTLSVESLPTAVINTADMAICNDGSNAAIDILLTGTAPYNFSYTINGANTKTVSDILLQPYKLIISAEDLHNLSGNGDYVIKVSDVWDATGSHGVSDFNKSVTITVKETPTPKVEGQVDVNFNQAGVIYHSGASVIPGHTYSWAISGGNITATNNNQATVKWGPLGTTNAYIELTETAASGCSTVNRLDVNLSEMPTPNVSGDNKACIGDTKTYSTFNATGHTFKWTVSAGGAIQGSDSGNEVQIKWNTIGNTRKVRVTESVDGNTEFSEISVDVFALPLNSYTLTYDNAPISGLTAKVTINALLGGLNVKVYDDSDNSLVGELASSGAGGDTDVNYNPTRDGKYYIILTNENGCEMRLINEISITLTPPFTPVITEDNANHCGGHSDSFTATANADYTYKWTILKCNVTDDTTNPVAVTWDNPTLPTTITVTVKLVVTHKVSGKTVEVTKDVTVTRTPETGEQYHVINNFN